VRSMESYLNENFGDVKAKNSSEEALQRWRKLCWLVKNPKRRFRFTANLSKRVEADAIRRSNQVLQLPSHIFHFFPFGNKILIF
jgi:Ca2+-transporting ATPase